MAGPDVQPATRTRATAEIAINVRAMESTSVRRRPQVGGTVPSMLRPSHEYVSSRNPMVPFLTQAVTRPPRIQHRWPG